MYCHLIVPSNRAAASHTTLTKPYLGWSFHDGEGTMCGCWYEPLVCLTISPYNPYLCSHTWLSCTVQQIQDYSCRLETPFKLLWLFLSLHVIVRKLRVIVSPQKANFIPSNKWNANREYKRGLPNTYEQTRISKEALCKSKEKIYLSN